MAAVIEDSWQTNGNFQEYVGTLTITGTYTTGGDAIDFGSNERMRVVSVSGKGYVWEWDQANQKLLMYRDNGTATAAALPQVANAADHTAASGVTFRALGQ
jgi:hypothetical protein